MARFPQPTVVDLFCGAGGMSHGFEQAGFRVLAGVDHDNDSLTSFKANHKGSLAIKADLEHTTPQAIAELIGIKPGELDCLVGGPPCQGFSRNRAFRHQEGQFVDDPRNHLLWHFFTFVDYFRPNIVVLENVPELLIKSNGAFRFRDAIYDRFNTYGYHVEARIVNASEYGVPQWRKRAIFLAGRDQQSVPFPQPTTLPGPRAGRRTPTSVERIGPKGTLQPSLGLGWFDLDQSPTVWEAISDLYGVYADGLEGHCPYADTPQSAYQTQLRGNLNNVGNHFPWKLSDRQLARIRLLKEGQSQLHLPPELQTKEGYGSAYRRLQSDAQALTITTWMFHPGSGMFTHPFEDRVITIREAARLQSFQDRFRFYGRYHSQCRQVGNAVAPLVAKSLAAEILEVLGSIQSAEVAQHR